MSAGTKIPGTIKISLAEHQDGTLTRAVLVVSRQALEDVLKTPGESLTITVEAERIPLYFEPLGLKEPYVWRATLREAVGEVVRMVDGVEVKEVKSIPGDVLVAGDKLPEYAQQGKKFDETPKGSWRVMKKPEDIPVDRLMRLELIPAHSSSAWRPMSVDLQLGDRLEYKKTIDKKVEEGGSNRQLYWGCAQVKLGRTRPTGETILQRAYLDGSFDEVTIPAPTKTPEV